MSHQFWEPCRRHNLSPNQLFFLDCCRDKIAPGTLINVNAERIVCESKGLIDSNGHLTEKALAILEEKDTYLVKTKKKVAVAVLGEDYLEKVQEYRNYFPEGKLPTGAVARQNVQQLKERFTWFFKTYPEFDWDLVLEAAKYYRFCKERENFMYMQTSSYFIKKTDPRTKDTTSGLADYCQMILDRPTILIDETNL